MALVTLIGVLAAVIAVRELVRRLVAGQPFRIRSVFEVVTPGKRRALVILAGLAATYLAVATVGFVVGAVYGVTTGADRYAVGEVLRDGAAAGKLLRGDVILAVDGDPLFTRKGLSLVDRVNKNAGAPVRLDVQRGNQRLTVEITPKPGVDKQGKSILLIGIRPRVEVGLDDSAGAALRFGITYPAVHVKYLVTDFIDEIRGGDVDPGGAVRISEDFRAAFEVRVRALELALYFAAHLFVLAALFDLVRLGLLARKPR